MDHARAFPELLRVDLADRRDNIFDVRVQHRWELIQHAVLM